MGGMSYRQRPQPLLRRVNGKARFNLERTVPDEAPPLGSSDEEKVTSTYPGALKGKAKGKAKFFDSDSDNSSRGQITKTTFSAATTKSEREGGGRNSKARARLSKASKTRDESPPATKRRRLDNAVPGSDMNAELKPFSSSAEHLKDRQGFTKRKVAKQTYGQKYGQKPGSSQEPQSSKVKHRTLNREPRLKIPNTDYLDSPETSDKVKFRGSPDDDLSTPPRNSPAKFKYPKIENEDSDDISDSPMQKIAARKAAAKLHGKKRVGNIWKALPKALPTAPKSPKIKFMKPAELSSFTPGSPGRDDGPPKNPHLTTSELSELSDLSDLSSLPDLESSEDSGSTTKASQPNRDNADETSTVCPWCGDNVQEALLKEFSKGKRLNVRMQSKFCQKHKKQTAADTWRERRYPECIFWSSLRSRFDDHHPYLLKVVCGEPSHFRSILANKIETGKARNLKKEHNLNPGYYGPRGFNIMCDYLVGEFGDMLKEKAVSDRVIAGRGSAAFIQSVLVAELAVRLIQEDMSVSVEDARNILEESKPLGDIMHEEVSSFSNVY